MRHSAIAAQVAVPPVFRFCACHFAPLYPYPVGTGAFLLKEWIRGSKLTLVRNPNYREVLYPSEGEAGDKEKGLLADAGKRLPLLDKAVIRVIEEDQPYWLTFMNKETDYAGIPKDNFGSVINEQRDLTGDMQEKGISLIKWPEPTTFWIGFNMEDPVIGKNLPLRQALNAAFNKKKYIELFTNNRAIAARGPLPPTVAEYNPDLNSPYTQYDPELAKKKIKEAEAVHGGPLPKLTMLLPGTDTTSVQMGQFYVRNFKAVGLDVEFDAMDFPAMQEKVNTKSAQMWAMGWIMDWPDSENMLSLWYGPNEAPGNNGMNYKNPEFDALHKKIAVMRDGEERRQLLRKMEQIVVDDLPCIFASHRQNFLLKYNWFKNHKPHVYGYGLLKFHNVDAKLRFEKTGR